MAANASPPITSPNPRNGVFPATDTEPANRQTLLMIQARSRTSFDTETLTHVIHDGKAVVEARRAAWSRVEAVTGTNDTSKLPDQYAKTSREELYAEGLRMGRAAWEDSVKYKHDFFGEMTARYALTNSSPFGLTKCMFNKSLELMATSEQKDRWLIPACQGRINGAYVQTELGHGTNVAGIETTATFDHVTDQFILHTPSISATKYWPGSLGYSATHAIVMARLIIPSATDPTKLTDYGVHPFFLPLRDTETGKPTPGLELGDVGLKAAHNQNDNGYAIFDHVALPRSHLLMGQASVDRNGRYSKATHAKSMYGTMMYVRSFIVKVCALQLAAAATIAVRYSTVREQGTLPFSPSGSQEISVMDFKTQHYRLLTSLSKAYAILFAAKHAQRVHIGVESCFTKKDYSTLAHAHALLAGLKSWSSDVASVGAEDVRKCCGGHGYLNISGLPELVQSLTAICTLEGENVVMMQQTARYLMKMMAEPQVRAQGRWPKNMHPDLEYLSKPVSGQCTASGDDFLNPATQLAIYQHRARRLVHKAYARLSIATTAGTAKPTAWNNNMILLISAARAHIELSVLRSFITTIPTLPDSVRPPLAKMCSLFALSHITNPTTVDALTFIEDGHLSTTQLDTTRHLVDALLSDLLPDAIGLTDAWDFTDAGLASAIGMKDGDAYECLMSWTRQLPINVRARANGGVDPGWESSVKPALSCNL